MDVEEGTSTSTTVELTVAPGIKTAVNDTAWVSSAPDEDDPSGSNRRQLYRLSKPAAENAGFTFSASLMDQVSLPPVVVPRSLLRTVLGVDNESRTHAWFWIESHPASVAFSLPDRVQWIRARIDGRAADQVEHDPSGGFYRLSLPAESQFKPVLVELEYQLSGTWADQVCAPPELPAEAVVLQTLWEVQIPWSQALIGVPPGWADENDWHWDFYVWKRRPWKPFSKLVGWVAGSSAQTASLDDLLGEEQDSSHSYLFGRAGKPVAMNLWLANRAGIIAVCSGSVLLLGFLLMFSRAPIPSDLDRDGGALPAGFGPGAPERAAAGYPIGSRRSHPHIARTRDSKAGRAGPVVRCPGQPAAITWPGADGRGRIADRNRRGGLR